MAADTIHVLGDRCRACRTAKRDGRAACWWHIIPYAERPPTDHARQRPGRLL